MITGRWGKPSEVLLDLVVEGDGSVRGVANPGTQNAPIRRGQFDAISGVVNLEGELFVWWKYSWACVTFACGLTTWCS
jgi:hypothetical protein